MKRLHPAAIEAAEILDNTSVEIERIFLDAIAYRRHAGQREGRATKVEYNIKIRRMAKIVQGAIDKAIEQKR